MLFCETWLKVFLCHFVVFQETYQELSAEEEGRLRVSNTKELLLTLSTIIRIIVVPPFNPLTTDPIKALHFAILL